MSLHRFFFHKHKPCQKEDKCSKIIRCEVCRIVKKVYFCTAETADTRKRHIRRTWRLNDNELNLNILKKL